MGDIKFELTFGQLHRLVLAKLELDALNAVAGSPAPPINYKDLSREKQVQYLLGVFPRAGDTIKDLAVLKNIQFLECEKKAPTLSTPMPLKEYLAIVQSHGTPRSSTPDGDPEELGYMLIIDSGAKDEYTHWMSLTEYNKRYLNYPEV